MTIRSAVVCLFLGLSASGCGSGGSHTLLSATDLGKNYKFSDNQLPGWTQTPADQDQAAFGTYTGLDELVSRIDGGADAYTTNGCEVFMYQDLTGPYPEICTVAAMDCGTSANATSMFSYEKKSAPLSIPGYDAATAAGSETLGGLNVYAHFDWAYFEVQLSGFADPNDPNGATNMATADAAAKQFLDVLKSKTN